ncbi:MAG: alpha/beta hydrolase [Gammaproteobacteria bacterium]|nr:alpha/beta hydrolase [Gammaproteobacteria bacterium]
MIKKILLLLAALLLIAVVVASLALQDRPGRPALGASRIAAGSGGDIEYFESGQGDAVVLLASYARGASDFNELAANLNTAGYRTLAINSRGIGSSALGSMDVSYYDLAGDVSSVLASAGVTEPAFLVGHAFGNRIARAFATAHGERVRAVVLLSAGGEAPTPAPVSQAIQTVLFSFWSAAAREDAVQFAFFADGNTAPDYWLSGWYPLAGMLQARANVATASGWADGGQAPLMIVQSLQDRAAPPEQAGRVLAARLPERSDYVEIANAGHATLPEQPQRVAAELIRFFGEH